MPSAKASHILVSSQEKANDLKTQIESGEDFGKLAKENSSCPSGKQGGSLGEFEQGQMVPEFDKIVFGDLPVGEISNPVKTSFGYHLVRVDERNS